MKIKYKEFLNACTPYGDGTKEWRTEYNTEFFNKFFDSVVAYYDEVNKHIFSSYYFTDIENGKYVRSCYDNYKKECISIEFILYENGNFEIKNKLYSRRLKLEKERAEELLNISTKYAIDLLSEIKRLNLFIEE